MGVSIMGKSVRLDLQIDNPKLADAIEEVAEEDRGQFVGSLLEAALVARSAFVVDLETQTVKASVDAAVEAMDAYFKKFQKTLNEKIELLADPENGEFVRTFGNLVDASFTDLLDPDNPDSSAPLVKLKTHLDTLEKNLKSYLDPVRSKLGITSDRKGTEAGADFENIVSYKLESLSLLFGDEILQTGDTRIEGTTRLIGDVLAQLNVEHLPGISPRVSFEAKTDKKFKRLDRKNHPNQANDEAIKSALDEMIEVNQSKVGVFILDSDYLDMDNQVRWKQFGDNKLLIVVDRLNPSDEYLQLAYAWARWRASLGESLEHQPISIKDFEEQLNSIVKQLDFVVTIKKTLSTGIAAINKGKGQLDELSNSIKDSITGLLVNLGSDVPLDD